MGYFREEKKGSGLFFSTPIQGARGFGSRWYRCKAGVHSWLIVFLDSLLSQRMTDGMGAYPAPSSPSRVPFFFRNG